MLNEFVGQAARSDQSEVPIEAAELCVLEQGMLPKLVENSKRQNLEA